MRIGHIELPVSDPSASRRFYEDTLGFEVDQVQGERYVWLRSGAMTILLNPDLSPTGGDLERRANLVLYTGRLPERVAALREAGIELLARHGCYHFEDPDGNAFQLVDPGEDHSGDQA